MIVHIVVPLPRKSLSPDKIAAHMNEMLDTERNDHVTSVSVVDTDGYTHTWTEPGIQ